MTKEELIELSDLNREDNIKYISSEAQGIAITLNSDKYAPTLCKLERAYICGRRKSEEQIAELEAQIDKMKKYGKLLQDICTVMGNDPYMVSVGLENRVKVLWDSSEEEDGLKMVEDIENRLLKIKPQDWAEIEKWEIKEND